VVLGLREGRLATARDGCWGNSWVKSKLALLNVDVEEAWKAKEHVRVASEFLVSLKVRVCPLLPTSDDDELPMAICR
jgi:hypothetical protein